MDRVYNYQTIRTLPVKSSLSNDDYIVIECRDGTKIMKATNIISTGITNNLFFENISQLANATNSLDEGSIAITLGYRKVGDGGGAKYIVEYAPGEVANNYTIIDIAGKPTLKAHLIMDNVMFPEQIGAYGDGEHDDSYILNVFLGLDVALSFYPNKTYKANNLIIPKDNMDINFNYCTLESDNTTITVFNRKNINISNCNIKSAIGIDISSSENIKVSNISIVNKHNVISSYGGINISNSNDIVIDNISIDSTYSVGNGITLFQNNDSIIINNLTSNNCRYPINMNNLSINKSVSIINSNFKLDTNGTGVYITGEYSDLYIKDSMCTGGEMFINNLSLSSANIVVENINIIDTNNIYNINDNTTHLVLKGIHKYDTQDLNKTVFGSLLGEVYLQTNDINCTLYTELSKNAIHSGKIADMNSIDNCLSNPIDVDVLSTNGTLIIDSFRNHAINITGTMDVASISSGITGQIIDLRSSDGRSLLKNTYTIEIDSAVDVGLHKYKGIRLIYKNNKWVQI